MKLKIILETSQDGGYAVHVPALRGCHTQGETVEEALENARDAINLYLDVSNQIIYEHSQTFEIEVA